MMIWSLVHQNKIKISLDLSAKFARYLLVKGLSIVVVVTDVSRTLIIIVNGLIIVLDLEI